MKSYNKKVFFTLSVILLIIVIFVYQTKQHQQQTIRQSSSDENKTSLTASPDKVGFGENVNVSWNIFQSEEPITLSPTIQPTITPFPNSWWKPEVNTSWQIQLSNPPIDQSLTVQAYDIDGFDNDASIVAALHAKGAKVICYFSAGTFENWRSDANQFPAAVLGSDLPEWPGEKWLDIRNINGLTPVIRARMDMCKQKGFDAIDPDNVDGYANQSGFPLTAQDQINYNNFLAQEGHARGLAVGLKNDIDQIPNLVSSFDFQVNEQCFAFGECNTVLPFIQAGKPVFNIEYDLQTTQFCQQANNMNFNSLKKNLALDAPREACR